MQDTTETAGLRTGQMALPVPLDPHLPTVPARARKRRANPLAASLADALDQRRLILLMPVAMIGGVVVELAFGILFGGIVLTLALAVGLGSREIVSRSLEKNVERSPDLDHIPTDPTYKTPPETLRHF